MAGSVNKVILIGNLGRDPDIRTTQDGRKIAEYSMATFWLVLPTLPMFVIYPWLFSRGMSFWPALSISIVIMLVFYGVLALFMSAPDAVATNEA